jgi:hypothetical protein
MNPSEYLYFVHMQTQAEKREAIGGQYWCFVNVDFAEKFCAQLEIIGIVDKFGKRKRSSNPFFGLKDKQINAVFISTSDMQVIDRLKVIHETTEHHPGINFDAARYAQELEQAYITAFRNNYTSYYRWTEPQIINLISALKCYAQDPSLTAPVPILSVGNCNNLNWGKRDSIAVAFLDSIEISSTNLAHVVAEIGYNNGHSDLFLKLAEIFNVINQRFSDENKVTYRYVARSQDQITAQKESDVHEEQTINTQTSNMSMKNGRGFD